jgi:aromatic ring-opening dioxygenase LigB subunit
MPHGDEIIDIPNEHSRKLNSEISKLAGTDNSDVIVVLSPHGINLSKNIGIINTERFLSDTKLKSVHLRDYWENERKLCENIIRESGDIGEEVRYATYSGEESVFPMDFGTSIPLYFFKKRPIVLIGQSRSIGRHSQKEFGMHLARTLMNYEKSVSIIFSADQAHTHSADGPYGYSQEAEVYEEKLKRCIEHNNFGEMEEIDQDIVDQAKPDSFWNILVMSRFLSESKRKMRFVYGYVERYFGMFLAISDKE